MKTVQVDQAKHELLDYFENVPEDAQDIDDILRIARGETDSAGAALPPSQPEAVAVRLLRDIWKAYGVCVSNGDTRATHERHLIPEVKKIPAFLNGEKV